LNISGKSVGLITSNANFMIKKYDGQEYDFMNTKFVNIHV